MTLSRRLAAVVAALAGVGALFAFAFPSSAASDRTAVLLAINDVYRIEGLRDGTIGGLARVRALRLELEREAPDLLMLHGGDFLFPSFASRMYHYHRTKNRAARCDPRTDVPARPLRRRRCLDAHDA